MSEPQWLLILCFQKAVYQLTVDIWFFVWMITQYNTVSRSKHNSRHCVTIANSVQLEKNDAYNCPICFAVAVIK